MGCCNSVYAQRPRLHVVVVNLEKRPIAGVSLSIKGSNVTSELTDKMGRTQLQIPSGVLPGETICLRMSHGPKGMLVISPLDGCVVIPLPKNSSPFVVSIVLSRHGDASVLREDLERSKREFVAAATRVSRELYSLGKYKEAVKSYREALTIHNDDPEILTGLGQALTKLGNYKEAETTLIRARDIGEKNLGPEHSSVAKTLQSLGSLYHEQGRFAEADALYRRALAIINRLTGPASPALATTLNSLGAVSADKNDFSQAKVFFEQAIAVLDKARLAESSEMASTLNNLANVYRDLGNIVQAEELYQRALSILRKTAGPEHPQFALLLDNLGALYMARGDYRKAEPLLNQALTIREKMAGIDDVAMAYSLHNIAMLHLNQGNYQKAEPYLLRSLEIRKAALGSDSPDVAYVLSNLGDLYSMKGDFLRAEPLYRRALESLERVDERPGSAAIMKRLARLYTSIDAYNTAASLYANVLEIQETLFGNNLELASTLDDYAELLLKMNRREEASRLAERANLIKGNNPIKGTNPSEPLFKNSYALLIGESSYKNWPSLPGARRDIQEVEEILKDHGFEVTVIMDPTRQQFDETISNFRRMMDTSNQSRFLFYFKGHGYTEINNGIELGYIVPADAPLPNEDRGGFTAKAISMNEMETIARVIAPSHALFLLDSYFSGSHFRTMRGVPETIIERAKLPVRLFITAGTDNQSVPDKSIFREAFVKALRGEADRNRDRFVTGTELGEYIMDYVSEQSGGRQTPRYAKINDPRLDQGDFIFNLPGQAQPFKSFLLDSQYYPSGLMGDVVNQGGKVTLAKETATVEGRPVVSTKIDYKRGRTGWAGIYWQHPDGNWGDKIGFSLVGAKKISFYAKGERGGEIVEFKSGGIRTEGKPYQDSFMKSTGEVVLTTTWTKYTIDLSDLTEKHLSSVIGAFCWVAKGGFDKDGRLVTYIVDLKVE